MTPGGEIDGPSNGKGNYTDPSFEAALVREFLEETGLPSFPKISNARYYDYGNPAHTRMFFAETSDRLNKRDFNYQAHEVCDHKLEQLTRLIGQNPYVDYNAKHESIRYPGSLKMLGQSPGSWFTGWKNASDLETFAGASLYTDGKGNKVIKRGANYPSNFYPRGKSAGSGGRPISAQASHSQQAF